MDLTPAPETTALVSALDALLAKESTPARVRVAETTGFDPALWATVTSFGIPGLALDAEIRSDELLVALAETAGTHLASVPLVETLVTASLLSGCTGEDAARLVAHIADGDIATFVLHPIRTAVAQLVPAGAIADIVLAYDGTDLTATIAPAPETMVANVASLPLADRDLNAGERLVLASGQHAAEIFATAQRRWQLLTAAQLVGIADKALQIGVEYVRGRVIFDRPVATFQTVAHRLADHVTDLDGARLLVQEAAWAADIHSPRATELATMAFCFIGEKATTIVGDCLHYHGGYGFTLEYDIQLYYRRARAYPLVWGPVAQEWQRLADELYGAVPMGAA
jgi:alkylation response protein AidB-like acyl-CoA dehydrogenase